MLTRNQFHVGTVDHTQYVLFYKATKPRSKQKAITFPVDTAKSFNFMGMKFRGLTTMGMFMEIKFKMVFKLYKYTIYN